MGKTMKQDRKSNSTAKFAEAVSYILELIERNSSKDDSKPTTITITVKGDSEETEEFEIDNLNEVVKILKLNKD